MEDSKTWNAVRDDADEGVIRETYRTLKDLAEHPVDERLRESFVSGGAPVSRWTPRGGDKR